MDDLDRILSSEDALEPSSGFTAAVMDAVRDAAEEPPPLTFPWLRFVIGVIACGVWAASGAALLASVNVPAVREWLSDLAVTGPEFWQAAAIVLATVVFLQLPRILRRPSR
jgi:hypothetical protein